MTYIDFFGKNVAVIVVVSLLLSAGLGAAAGASISGSVDGDSTTDVEQVLTVNTTDPGDIPHKDSLVGTNDDGTEFRTAARIHQGDDYTINLNLQANGQHDTKAELVLDVPSPLEVEMPHIDGHANATAVNGGENRWWLELRSDDPGPFDIQLRIEVSAPAETEPGVYRIEGILFPVNL